MSYKMITTRLEGRIMEQLNNQQLKKAFHQEMINLYKKTSQELKYKSTRLLDLINKYGGYEAAVKFITTDNSAHDFAILWENERLDLSVEALIAREPYRELFLEDIVHFCDKKLEEYSYAPKKIETQEESFSQMLKDIFEDMGQDTFKQMAEIKAKDYFIYREPIAITKEDWKEIFVKPSIVTPKNQDMLLRMYLIEGYVEAVELSKEEGYSATYPYNEVVTALSKRIRANLKIEAPLSKEGGILWWHIVFEGGFKDNTCFEWRLRSELREAIRELIESKEVSIEGIEVQTHKSSESFLEEASIKEEMPSINTLEEIEEIEETQQIKELQEIEQRETMEELQETEQKEAIKEPEEVEQNEKIEQEVVKEVVSNRDIEAETVAHKKEDFIEAKQACIEYYGAICDLCGFDFGYTYGETFEGYIDVHNVKETGQKEILPDTNPIEDLIPICHNCHSIIHSQTPPYTVEQMRKLIKA